uniref:beta-glucosidase n=1 Tax=Chromera velia CCMP2878 TaxID=1169474 RepID=A0A0G4HZX5_9ALVE|eukprot:Cvel_9835.t1-p1 / transcript=Cvel_9835.t1 / gene=Cvel_9835 / organism=Chromera_velia_CCMP2878 / gene_product=Flocculation protein FLO11, putative / transcript_product=Flocculation protein FLO11, putative / location=Cvel_scaffold579:225-23392(+) / protein_length=5411 / sequence_SO=supercontig / SO=protein_coding / is_pseudo=false
MTSARAEGEVLVDPGAEFAAGVTSDGKLKVWHVQSEVVVFSSDQAGTQVEALEGLRGPFSLELDPYGNVRVVREDGSGVSTVWSLFNETGAPAGFSWSFRLSLETGGDSRIPSLTLLDGLGEEVWTSAQSTGTILSTAGSGTLDEMHAVVSEDGRFATFVTDQGVLRVSRMEGNDWVTLWESHEVLGGLDPSGPFQLSLLPPPDSTLRVVSESDNRTVWDSGAPSLSTHSLPLSVVVEESADIPGSAHLRVVDADGQAVFQSPADRGLSPPATVLEEALNHLTPVTAEDRKTACQTGADVFADAETLAGGSASEALPQGEVMLSQGGRFGLRVSSNGLLELVLLSLQPPVVVWKSDGVGSSFWSSSIEAPFRLVFSYLSGKTEVEDSNGEVVWKLFGNDSCALPGYLGSPPFALEIREGSQGNSLPSLALVDLNRTLFFESPRAAGTLLGGDSLPQNTSSSSSSGLDQNEALLSSDGSLVLTVREDGQVQLADSASGQVFWVSEGESSGGADRALWEPPFGLRVTSNGSIALVSRANAEEFIVWTLPEGGVSDTLNVSEAFSLRVRRNAAGFPMVELTGVLSPSGETYTLWTSLDDIPAGTGKGNDNGAGVATNLTVLVEGQSLLSSDGIFAVSLDENGELKLTDSRARGDTPVTLWSSTDATLGPGTLLLNSSSNAEHPLSLLLKDDCRLTVEGSGGTVLWTSHLSSPAAATGPCSLAVVPHDSEGANLVVVDRSTGAVVWTTEHRRRTSLSSDLGGSAAVLPEGIALPSPGGVFVALVSDDGDLQVRHTATGSRVFSARSAPVTGTFSEPGRESPSSSFSLRLKESEGNLEVFREERGSVVVTWSLFSASNSSSLGGSPPFELKLSDSAVLFLTDALNATLWSSAEATGLPLDSRTHPEKSAGSGILSGTSKCLGAFAQKIQNPDLMVYKSDSKAQVLTSSTEVTPLWSSSSSWSPLTTLVDNAIITPPLHLKASLETQLARIWAEDSGGSVGLNASRPLWRWASSQSAEGTSFSASLSSFSTASVVLRVVEIPEGSCSVSVTLEDSGDSFSELLFSSTLQGKRRSLSSKDGGTLPQDSPLLSSDGKFALTLRSDGVLRLRDSDEGSGGGEGAEYWSSENVGTLFGDVFSLAPPFSLSLNASSGALQVVQSDTGEVLWSLFDPPEAPGSGGAPWRLAVVRGPYGPEVFLSDGNGTVVWTTRPDTLGIGLETGNGSSSSNSRILPEGTPLMSSDGRFSAFVDSSGHLVLRDSLSSLVVWSSENRNYSRGIQTDTQRPFQMVLTANGTLEVQSVFDRNSPETLWSSVSTDSPQGTPPFSVAILPGDSSGLPPRIVIASSGGVSPVWSSADSQYATLSNPSSPTEPAELSAGVALLSESNRFAASVSAEGVLQLRSLEGDVVLWAASDDSSEADSGTFVDYPADNKPSSPFSLRIGASGTLEVFSQVDGRVVWTSSNGTEVTGNPPFSAWVGETSEGSAAIRLGDGDGNLIWEAPKPTDRKRVLSSSSNESLSEGIPLVSEDGRFALRLSSGGVVEMVHTSSGAVLFSSEDAGGIGTWIRSPLSVGRPFKLSVSDKGDLQVWTDPPDAGTSVIVWSLLNVTDPSDSPRGTAPFRLGLTQTESGKPFFQISDASGTSVYSSQHLIGPSLSSSSSRQTLSEGRAIISADGDALVWLQSSGVLEVLQIGSRAQGGVASLSTGRASIPVWSSEWPSGTSGPSEVLLNETRGSLQLLSASGLESPLWELGADGGEIPSPLPVTLRVVTSLAGPELVVAGGGQVRFRTGQLAEATGNRDASFRSADSQENIPVEISEGTVLLSRDGLVSVHFAEGKIEAVHRPTLSLLWSSQDALTGYSYSTATIKDWAGPFRYELRRDGFALRISSAVTSKSLWSAVAENAVIGNDTLSVEAVGCSSGDPGLLVTSGDGGSSSPVSSVFWGGVQKGVSTLLPLGEAQPLISQDCKFFGSLTKDSLLSIHDFRTGLRLWDSLMVGRQLVGSLGAVRGSVEFGVSMDSGGTTPVGVAVSSSSNGVVWNDTLTGSSSMSGGNLTIRLDSWNDGVSAVVRDEGGAVVWRSSDASSASNCAYVLSNGGRSSLPSGSALMSRDGGFFILVNPSDGALQLWKKNGGGGLGGEALVWSAGHEGASGFWWVPNTLSPFQRKPFSLQVMPEGRLDVVSSDGVTVWSSAASNSSSSGGVGPYECFVRSRTDPAVILLTDSTGTILWEGGYEPELSGPPMSPGVLEGAQSALESADKRWKAIVGTDGVLRIVDGVSGETLLSSEEFGNVLVDPQGDGGPFALNFTNGGDLQVVNRETGEIIWSLFNLSDSSAIAQPLLDAVGSFTPPPLLQLIINPDTGLPMLQVIGSGDGNVLWDSRSALPDGTVIREPGSPLTSHPLSDSKGRRDTLKATESILSVDGRHSLSLGTDGTLSLTTKPDTQVWTSHMSPTSPSEGALSTGPFHLQMTPEGPFAVVSSRTGAVLWSPWGSTFNDSSAALTVSGSPPFTLRVIVENSGMPTVVLSDAKGNVEWSSGDHKARHFETGNGISGNSSVDTVANAELPAGASWGLPSLGLSEGNLRLDMGTDGTLRLVGGEGETRQIFWSSSDTRQGNLLLDPSVAGEPFLTVLDGTTGDLQIVSERPEPEEDVVVWSLFPPNTGPHGTPPFRLSATVDPQTGGIPILRLIDGVPNELWTSGNATTWLADSHEMKTESPSFTPALLQENIPLYGGGGTLYAKISSSGVISLIERDTGLVVWTSNDGPGTFLMDIDAAPGPFAMRLASDGALEIISGVSPSSSENGMLDSNSTSMVVWRADPLTSSGGWGEPPHQLTVTLGPDGPALMVVDGNGTAVWSSGSSERQEGAISTTSPLASRTIDTERPLVDLFGNGVLELSETGRLVLRHRKTGAEIWSSDLSGFPSANYGSGGFAPPFKAVASNETGLVILAGDGRVVWTLLDPAAGGSSFSPPLTVRLEDDLFGMPTLTVFDGSGNSLFSSDADSEGIVSLPATDTAGGVLPVSSLPTKDVQYSAVLGPDGVLRIVDGVSGETLLSSEEFGNVLVDPRGDGGPFALNFTSGGDLQVVNRETEEIIWSLFNLSDSSAIAQPLLDAAGSFTPPPLLQLHTDENTGRPVLRVIDDDGTSLWELPEKVGGSLQTSGSTNRSIPVGRPLLSDDGRYSASLTESGSIEIRDRNGERSLLWSSITDGANGTLLSSELIKGPIELVLGGEGGLEILDSGSGNIVWRAITPENMASSTPPVQISLIELPSGTPVLILSDAAGTVLWSSDAAALSGEDSGNRKRVTSTVLVSQGNAVTSFDSRFVLKCSQSGEAILQDSMTDSILWRSGHPRAVGSGGFEHSDRRVARGPFALRMSEFWGLFVSDEGRGTPVWSSLNSSASLGSNLASRVRVSSVGIADVVVENGTGTLLWASSDSWDPSARSSTDAEGVLEPGYGMVSRKGGHVARLSASGALEIIDGDTRALAWSSDDEDGLQGKRKAGGPRVRLLLDPGVGAEGGLRSMSSDNRTVWSIPVSVPSAASGPFSLEFSEDANGQPRLSVTASSGETLWTSPDKSVFDSSSVPLKDGRTVYADIPSVRVALLLQAEGRIRLVHRRGRPVEIWGSELGGLAVTAGKKLLQKTRRRPQLALGSGGRLEVQVSPSAPNGSSTTSDDLLWTSSAAGGGTDLSNIRLRVGQVASTGGIPTVYVWDATTQAALWSSASTIVTCLSTDTGEISERPGGRALISTSGAYLAFLSTGRSYTGLLAPTYTASSILWSSAGEMTTLWPSYLVDPVVSLRVAAEGRVVAVGETGTEIWANEAPFVGSAGSGPPYSLCLVEETGGTPRLVLSDSHGLDLWTASTAQGSLDVSGTFDGTTTWLPALWSADAGGSSLVSSDGSYLLSFDGSTGALTLSSVSAGTVAFQTAESSETSSFRSVMSEDGTLKAESTDAGSDSGQQNDIWTFGPSRTPSTGSPLRLSLVPGPNDKPWLVAADTSGLFLIQSFPGQTSATEESTETDENFSQSLSCFRLLEGLVLQYSQSEILSSDTQAAWSNAQCALLCLSEVLCGAFVFEAANTDGESPLCVLLPRGLSQQTAAATSALGAASGIRLASAGCAVSYSALQTSLSGSFLPGNIIPSSNVTSVESSASSVASTLVSASSPSSMQTSSQSSTPDVAGACMSKSSLLLGQSEMRAEVLSMCTELGGTPQEAPEASILCGPPAAAFSGGLGEMRRSRALEDAFMSSSVGGLSGSFSAADGVGGTPVAASTDECLQAFSQKSSNLTTIAGETDGGWCTGLVEPQLGAMRTLDSTFAWNVNHSRGGKVANAIAAVTVKEKEASERLQNLFKSPALETMSMLSPASSSGTVDSADSNQPGTQSSFRSMMLVADAFDMFTDEIPGSTRFLLAFQKTQGLVLTPGSLEGGSSADCFGRCLTVPSCVLAVAEVLDDRVLCMMPKVNFTMLHEEWNASYSASPPASLYASHLTGAMDSVLGTGLVTGVKRFRYWPLSALPANFNLAESTDTSDLGLPFPMPDLTLLSSVSAPTDVSSVSLGDASRRRRLRQKGEEEEGPGGRRRHPVGSESKERNRRRRTTGVAGVPLDETAGPLRVPPAEDFETERGLLSALQSMNWKQKILQLFAVSAEFLGTRSGSSAFSNAGFILLDQPSWSACGTTGVGTSVESLHALQREETSLLREGRAVLEALWESTENEGGTFSPPPLVAVTSEHMGFGPPFEQIPQVHLPAASSIGASGDLRLLHALGRATAERLRALGVDALLSLQMYRNETTVESSRANKATSGFALLNGMQGAAAAPSLSGLSADAISGGTVFQTTAERPQMSAALLSGLSGGWRTEELVRTASERRRAGLSSSASLNSLLKGLRVATSCVIHPEDLDPSLASSTSSSILSACIHTSGVAFLEVNVADGAGGSSAPDDAVANVLKYTHSYRGAVLGLSPRLATEVLVSPRHVSSSTEGWRRVLPSLFEFLRRGADALVIGFNQARTELSAEGWSAAVAALVSALTELESQASMQSNETTSNSNSTSTHSVPDAAGDRCREPDWTSDSGAFLYLRLSSLIDASVLRILRAKLSVGVLRVRGSRTGEGAESAKGQRVVIEAGASPVSRLVEDIGSTGGVGPELQSAAHAALSREAAVASLVLLKNGPSFPLPLPSSAPASSSSVVVIGRTGSFSVAGGESVGTCEVSLQAAEIATSGGGLGRERAWKLNATEGVKIEAVSRGYGVEELTFAEVVGGAGASLGGGGSGTIEAVVAVLGEPPVGASVDSDAVRVEVGGNRSSDVWNLQMEREGSSSLTDEEILSRLLADIPSAASSASMQVVCVFLSDVPLYTNGLLNQCTSFVAAFRPGSSVGWALGSVLFGSREFEGRLPLPWPGVPCPSGLNDTTALFPPGFGLTTGDLSSSATLSAVRQSLCP